MVLSSLASCHYTSSFYGECTTEPSGRDPSDQADWLGSRMCLIRCCCIVNSVGLQRNSIASNKEVVLSSCCSPCKIWSNAYSNEFRIIAGWAKSGTTTFDCPRFIMPEPICCIFGTLQCRFVFNDYVNFTFVGYFMQSDATWQKTTHFSLVKNKKTASLSLFTS